MPSDIVIQSVEPWYFSGWSKHISPSGMGRAAACIRSEAMPTVHDNQPAARKGTIAHKFLADTLEHGRELALGMTEDVDDIDWLSGIDVERLPAFHPQAYEPEVAIAYHPATRTARALGKNLSRSEARALAKNDELVGILDVLGSTAEAAVVGDYKTGWGYVDPAETNWQLRTYALFGARFLKKEAADYSVIRVKDNGSIWFDTAHMDELDLLAHEEAILGAARAPGAGARPHPRRGLGEAPPLVEGKHCRYCPSPARLPCENRGHPCPGRGAGRDGTRAAGGRRGHPDAGAAPDGLAEGEGGPEDARRYEAIIRDLARQDPVPLYDGEVLGEKLVTREGIVPDRARAALEKHYGNLGAAVIGEASETKTTVTKKALKSRPQETGPAHAAEAGPEDWAPERPGASPPARERRRHRHAEQGRHRVDPEGPGRTGARGGGSLMPGVLTRTDLDLAVCSSPDCGHEPSGHGIFLHGRCHPKAGSRVSYANGVVTVACRTCKRLVVESPSQDLQLWRSAALPLPALGPSASSKTTEGALFSCLHPDSASGNAWPSGPFAELFYIG
jgi:hypothetical protein